MKTTPAYQHRKLFGGIGLILSVLSIVTFSLESAHGGKPPLKPRPSVHPTTIASVTGSSISVKEETMTKTFSISAFTEVTVNGQRATIADLKPGMIVSVTLRDPTTASRVVATGQ